MVGGFSGIIGVNCDYNSALAEKPNPLTGIELGRNKTENLISELSETSGVTLAGRPVNTKLGATGLRLGDFCFPGASPPRSFFKLSH